LLITPLSVDYLADCADGRRISLLITSIVVDYLADCADIRRISLLITPISTDLPLHPLIYRSIHRFTAIRLVQATGGCVWEA